MRLEIKKLIEIYLTRFSNRADVYAKQLVKGESFQYFPVWQSFTTDVMHSCLRGEFGLGIYALSANGFGKWICFDSDIADGQLKRLVNWLREHHWHVIEEGARPGKDGHAWILFDKPIPGKDLRILGSTMLKQSGAVVGELFPKQDKPPKVGSLVRAPLSRHFKPSANGCRGWFEGPPKDIKAQLEWLAGQPLNSAEVAMQLAYLHRPLPKPLILRNRDYDKNRIDFIAWAGDSGFSQKDNELIGPCPACIAFCPHHPRCELLSINVAKNAVHCWGGCTFKKILDAIKLDLFKAAV